MYLLENYGEAEGRREAGDDKRGSSLEVRSEVLGSHPSSSIFQLYIMGHWVNHLPSLALNSSSIK